MGSAIQAGGPAISRCRNWELNTAGPGTAEEGTRVLAGLRFGDGPRSVRGCPSSMKRDYGGSTTSTDERPLVNPREVTGASMALGQKTRARQEPAWTGRGHPLHGAGVPLACN
jgi:hypothetical protein